MVKKLLTINQREVERLNDRFRELLLAGRVAARPNRQLKFKRRQG